MSKTQSSAIDKEKITEIRLFGDSSKLRIDESIFAFVNSSSQLVICDYSECGLYIASKHSGKAEIEQLKKLITLRDVIAFTSSLLDSVKVTAHNNGYARVLEKQGIHDLGQLRLELNVWPNGRE